METPTNETPTTTNETVEHTSTLDSTSPEPVSLRQLLGRAGRVYDLTIAAALEAAEMDDLPMRGVSVLRRIGEGGAATPLAHVLRGGRISRQHGTQLVDTLVERGYIVRETDPEDRRRMRVSLTERGQAAADAVRTAIEGMNSALAEKVTPEQLDASRTVLSALIDLAPEGASPDWGPGPERGFGPRGGGRGRHEHGPGHDRGVGRGPRGPMRDFGPSGGWRDRMQAFAAAAEGDERPERGERHSRHDRAAFDGPRDGGEREEHSFGPRGGDHGRHGRGPWCGRRGERRGGAPTIVHHVDTMIVNASPASEGRGHGRRGHHGHRRGERPFGPWQGETARPETPETDAPPAE